MIILLGMKVLLASATETEIAPFVKFLRGYATPTEGKKFAWDSLEIFLLITGVGAVPATWRLTRFLENQKVDFALQIGVCGAFDKVVPLKSLFFIKEDGFGDLGAEDHYCFQDVFDLGLTDPNEAPFRQKRLHAPEHPLSQQILLPTATALTVHCTTGTAFTAQSRINKYRADVESMEGAAFHYACLQEKCPFAQIRTVSNYAETRNRDSWELTGAIDVLNHWLIEFTRTKLLPFSEEASR